MVSSMNICILFMQLFYRSLLLGFIIIVAYGMAAMIITHVKVLLTAVFTLLGLELCHFIF